ncbi:MAG: hypothetical protein RL684_2681 [Pseudomonadota bacterium]|jgi:uncharacterized membrane protein YgdD (TMEM256/DUF423 family)
MRVRAQAGRAAAWAAAMLSLGIAIGAFGAHVLKPRLDAALFATLQTAIQYQLANALGLLALGAWLRHAAAPGVAAPGVATSVDEPLATGLWWATRCVLIGTLLFSGSLYLLVAGAPRWLGALTPIGGLALIAGWALAARALWRSR